MNILKQIGYLAITLAGLCVAGGTLALILSASAVIAIVVLGGAGIAFIAFCVREYFGGPTESGPMDRDG